MSIFPSAMKLIPYGRRLNWTILSGIAGMVGVIGILLLSLSSEYRNENQHAELEVENITQVLEENVLATFNNADLLLLEVQRNVRPEDIRRSHGLSRSREQELHALLKSQVDSVPAVAVIRITDAKGDNLYSSLDWIPHINISDRKYFQRQRADATAGLVISAPLISRTTGKWTFILSRRLNFKDGSFAGIILVILDLNYFQNLYHTLNLGTDGLVALFDSDLRLAARYPSSENNLGKIANLRGGSARLDRIFIFISEALRFIAYAAFGSAGRLTK